MIQLRLARSVCDSASTTSRVPAPARISGLNDLGPGEPLHVVLEGVGTTTSADLGLVNGATMSALSVRKTEFALSPLADSRKLVSPESRRSGRDAPCMLGNQFSKDWAVQFSANPSPRIL